MRKRIMLEALITEREGMLAENQHTLVTRGYVAYGDEPFLDLADQIRAILDKPDERPTITHESKPLNPEGSRNTIRETKEHKS